MVIDVPQPYNDSCGIRCALCNKFVDRVEIADDPMLDGQRYRVYCHGQMEETVLTGMLLVECGHDMKLEPGMAFRERVLGHGVQLPFGR